MGQMRVKYKSVAELGEIVTGKTPSTEKAEYWRGNIPFITPTDIVGYDMRYIFDTERQVSDIGAISQKKTIIPPNSICVSCIASIGKMCITSAERSITNQQINTIIVKKDFDYRYIFYLLRHFLPYIQLIGAGTGSGTPIISKNKFSRLKYPMCDNIGLQKKIADILSAYDKLIEVNNERIKVLEQMAENLYKEWFVRFRFPGHETAKFENGIPKGWEEQRLSDLANVVMGQSPSSEFYNDDGIGMPFHQGVGSYGDFYLEDSTYSSEGTRIAEPNSIIFSIRAPVGRINLTLNRIILGRGVASINSKKRGNAFLLWQLKHLFSKEDTIGNGSIFTSVTRDELLRQRMLVPDNETQQRFEDIAEKVEKQLRWYYLANRNLIKQRDLLLPRLMNGKLEIHT